MEDMDREDDDDDDDFTLFDVDDVIPTGENAEVWTTTCATATSKSAAAKANCC